MPANQHCLREGEGCPFGFIWSLLPHCIMRASEVGWPVCPSSSEPVTGKLGREDQASSEAIVGKHVLHKESANRYSVPGEASSGSLPAVHQYPVFSFFSSLGTQLDYIPQSPLWLHVATWTSSHQWTRVMRWVPSPGHRLQEPSVPSPHSLPLLPSRKRPFEVREPHDERC